MTAIIIGRAPLTVKYRKNYGYHNPSSYHDTEERIGVPDWKEVVYVTDIPKKITSEEIVKMYEHIDRFYIRRDPDDPKIGYKDITKDITSRNKSINFSVPTVTYTYLKDLYDRKHRQLLYGSKKITEEKINKEYEVWLKYYLEDLKKRDRTIQKHKEKRDQDIEKVHELESERKEQRKQLFSELQELFTFQRVY